MKWQPWKSVLKGLKVAAVAFIGIFVPDLVEFVQAKPELALYAPLILGGLSAAKNAAKIRLGLNIPF